MKVTFQGFDGIGFKTDFDQEVRLCTAATSSFGFGRMIE
jgi:hypothetical protein